MPRNSKNQANSVNKIEYDEIKSQSIRYKNQRDSMTVWIKSNEWAKGQNKI